MAGLAQISAQPSAADALEAAQPVFDDVQATTDQVVASALAQPTGDGSPGASDPTVPQTDSVSAEMPNTSDEAAASAESPANQAVKPLQARGANRASDSADTPSHESHSVPPPAEIGQATSAVISGAQAANLAQEPPLIASRPAPSAQAVDSRASKQYQPPARQYQPARATPHRSAVVRPAAVDSSAQPADRNSQAEVGRGSSKSVQIGPWNCPEIDKKDPPIVVADLAPKRAWNKSRIDGCIAGPSTGEDLPEGTVDVPAAASSPTHCSPGSQYQPGAGQYQPPASEPGVDEGADVGDVADLPHCVELDVGDATGVPIDIGTGDSADVDQSDDGSTGSATCDATPPGSSSPAPGVSTPQGSVGSAEAGTAQIRFHEV